MNTDNPKEQPSPYEFFSNKRTDRIYLSRALESKELKKNDQGEVVEIKKPVRIVSKVFDTEHHQFIRDGKEIILRITPKARQEVIAKFYEDSRSVFALQIQRFSTTTGNPHEISFSFIGDEISKLYNFIGNIAQIPIKGKEREKFDENILNDIVLTKEQFLKIISDSPQLIEVVKEVVNSQLKHEDLIALSHRKEQLRKFDSLLHDEEFFENEMQELTLKSTEAVWQKFFETNSWILGYGLNYIYNSELDGKKLEQVVKGNDFNNSGKRVDLMMKTRGLINSFCFGEIKTHKTPLLKTVKDAYRRDCWAASDELAGGVAQIQKTIQKSIKNIETKTAVKDQNGDLTGEQLYLYQPKSFLLIGSLNEFIREYGINEEKFSSFELFRKNMFNPEIITFDELFERAKNIVRNPLTEITA